MRGRDVHTLGDAYEMSLAGDYDIILLDVSMPDGNGLELLPRLKLSPQRRRSSSSPARAIRTAPNCHQERGLVLSGQADHYQGYGADPGPEIPAAEEKNLDRRINEK